MLIAFLRPPISAHLRCCSCGRSLAVLPDVLSSLASSEPPSIWALLNGLYKWKVRWGRGKGEF